LDFKVQLLGFGFHSHEKNNIWVMTKDKMHSVQLHMKPSNKLTPC